MSGVSGDQDQGGSGMISKIVSMAGIAGKSVVVPMVQGYIRDEMLRILNQHDPEKLESYILVQYPLVQQDAPDNVKSGLQRVGPMYAEEIRQTVTPDNILSWMENPEEHVEAEEDDYENIRACAEIIKETPGGRQWLESQVLAVWVLCDVADTGA